MPATETQLNEAVETLKRLQHEQFEKMEPKTLDLLKKQLGVSEMSDGWEKINGDVAKSLEQITKLAGDLAEEKKEAERERLQLNTRLDEAEKLFKGQTSAGEKSPRLSDRFLAAPWASDPGSVGKLETGKINVGFFPLKAYKKLGAVSGIDDLSTEALKMISGAVGSADALTDSFRVSGIISEPNTTLSVQDLIPTTVTEHRDIDWVVETLLTDNAAPVAESATGSLVSKPESDIAFALRERTMRTIATWIPATKQILQDSRRAQLRSHIDFRLTHMVDREVESQVLTGDGTGQNLEGLIPAAAAYTGGYAQISGADPTFLDTLRRAKTQARLAEYPVTGHVLNPAAWQEIELLKGSDLHYIFAQPGSVVVPRVWGVPVVESTLMPATEFLSGAFQLGAELFTQGDATIEVSRSHASFFIQNVVAILGELRALLAIYRPQAFVTGSLIVPGS